MSSVREQRRRTRSGEAGPPPPPPKSPGGKGKGKKKEDIDETVRWVDDDTLFDDDDEEDDDDSTYVDEECSSESESDEKTIHGIRVPGNMPVSVKIHLHANVGDAEMEYEDEEEDEDEEEGEDGDDDEVDDEFLAKYLARQLGHGYRSGQGQMLIIADDSTSKGKKSKVEKDEIPIKLYRKEREYYDEMPRKARKEMLKKMYTVSDLLGESEMPFKFRVLELDTTPKIQT